MKRLGWFARALVFVLWHMGYASPEVAGEIERLDEEAEHEALRRMRRNMDRPI